MNLASIVHAFFFFCLVISGCNILTNKHDFLLTKQLVSAGTCHVCKRLGNGLSIQIQFLNFWGTGIFLSFLSICIVWACNPYTQRYKPTNAWHTISQPPEREPETRVNASATLAAFSWRNFTGKIDWQDSSEIVKAHADVQCPKQTPKNKELRLFVSSKCCWGHAPFDATQVQEMDIKVVNAPKYATAQEENINRVVIECWHVRRTWIRRQVRCVVALEGFSNAPGKMLQVRRSCAIKKNKAGPALLIRIRINTLSVYNTPYCIFQPYLPYLTVGKYVFGPKIRISKNPY